MTGICYCERMPSEETQVSGAGKERRGTSEVPERLLLLQIWCLLTLLSQLVAKLHTNACDPVPC